MTVPERRAPLCQTLIGGLISECHRNRLNEFSQLLGARRVVYPLMNDRVYFIARQGERKREIYIYISNATAIYKPFLNNIDTLHLRIPSIRFHFTIDLIISQLMRILNINIYDTHTHIQLRAYFYLLYTFHTEEFVKQTLYRRTISSAFFSLMISLMHRVIVSISEKKS